MPRLIDLTDKNVGRWTVEQRVLSTGRHVMWRCRCACGTVKDVPAYALIHEESKSCGCLIGDVLKARNTTHGRARTREYASWSMAKNRCHNPTAARWDDYGGRGIEMCEQWRHSFQAFYDDMGQRPLKTSLDRIDNGGHYEPSNCQWSTTKEQNQNKRPVSRCQTLTWNNQTLPVRDWSLITGLPAYLIHRRLYYKWPIERVLTQRHNKHPPRP